MTYILSLLVIIVTNIKTNPYTQIGCMILICLALFSSCKEKDNSKQSQVFGDWRLTGYSIGEAFDLNNDGVSHLNLLNEINCENKDVLKFETTGIVEPVTEIIPAVKIEVEATPIVEIIEEEIAPVIIPEKTYYIIAGAFAEQRNANKMIAKLKRWNYNTEIVPGGNLLRVSYDSFTNKADALVALHQIKQENSDAWLLSL